MDGWPLMGRRGTAAAGYPLGVTAEGLKKCHDGQVRTVNEDDSSSAPVEGPPADNNTYPDADFSFGLERRGSSVLDLARAGRKPERHLTRGRHTPRLTTCTRLQGAMVVEEGAV